jgi:benzoylformate decarboxylase
MVTEMALRNRAAVAGLLDRLAEYLAAIMAGKLAVIAGDEISTSNAAAETVLLAAVSGNLHRTWSDWWAHNKCDRVDLSML